MSGIAEWTKPGVLFAILGWVGMVYTSYDQFKDASVNKIDKLEWRVEALEAKNADQETHFRATDGYVADHGLRIDRLERGNR